MDTFDSALSFSTPNTNSSQT